MFLENGVWISKTEHRLHGRPGGPAIFLDRDGVLVREVNYLARIEDVALEAGAVEVIRFAHEQNMAVAIITNQAGIARGHFGWNEFENVNSEITSQLAAQNVYVDLTIACPFHPEFSVPYTADMQAWRKPGPAMLTYAIDVLGCEKSSSWMVGDVANDMQAAKSAGLKGGIHVLTGHGQRERADALKLSDSSFHVEGVSNLLAAVDFLRSNMVQESKEGFRK